MLLSIVVPVYNVREYLNRCVDSLLKEDPNESYEIVLVDDGSSDSSEKICDEISSEHDYVKVIHKTNGGLSSARNVGIENAQGEYVMFVDSDDYLIKGSLKQLIDAIEEYRSDVIVGQSLIVCDDKEPKFEGARLAKKGLYSSDDYSKLLKKSRKNYYPCAPYHICRRSLLTENDLFFKSGILHEDELWTPKVLIKAETIFYSEILFYCHYMRTGSIMHSDNGARRGESYLEVARELSEFYRGIKGRDIGFYRNRLSDNLLLGACLMNDYEKVKKMRTVPIRNARYPMTFIKSLIFLISPRLYVFIRNRLKG